MMKEIGLNSVRTSIQWTRLMKDFETGETDADGVRFYNAVIDEFLRQAGAADVTLWVAARTPRQAGEPA